MHLYGKTYFRLRVSFEILLIILMSCSLFDIRMFQPLFRNDNAIITYMLMLAYFFIRNMGFSFRVGISQKMRPLWWLLAGVLLSFIPAYLFYGQHLYYSVVAYRHFLGYFAFFALLSVQPRREELKMALYAFTVIYFICTLYVSFVNPKFIVFEAKEGLEFIEEGDFVHMLRGIQFLPLAYIFALDDLRKEKIGFKNSLMAVFVFLVIFMIQNRSILFSCIVLTIFAALANKSARRRLITGSFMLVLLALAIVFMYHYIDRLVVETIDQLSDQDYNRVKAFMYFTSGENGFLSLLLGNGFISGKVNPIMENLRLDGIYHSDLGLIGFWHQFGLIPVIVIVTLCVKSISSLHEFIVRANGLNILLCALTISYFHDFGLSLWLCLFMFLYETDDQYVIAKRRRDEVRIQKIMKRYRSLSV